MCRRILRMVNGFFQDEFVLIYKKINLPTFVPDASPVQSTPWYHCPLHLWMTYLILHCLWNWQSLSWKETQDKVMQSSQESHILNVQISFQACKWLCVCFTRQTLKYILKLYYLKTLVHTAYVWSMYENGIIGCVIMLATA